MDSERKNMFDRLIPTDNNTRDRINLKRAVGKSLCDVNPQTMTAFYRNVFCPQHVEERLFYIACLFCEQGKNGTMEVPAAWAIYSKSHDIPNGRIARLVDSEWTDNLAVSLVRIISRMMADGYSIDFEQLAVDVVNWNTGKTKREWARKMSRIEEVN